MASFSNSIYQPHASMHNLVSLFIVCLENGIDKRELIFYSLSSCNHNNILVLGAFTSNREVCDV